jgi:hypothetical protein
MPSRDDDAASSDYAFLEGRLLRVESEQKAIRRIHGELADQVERLTDAIRRFREENDRGDPWRETTDVRNQRRVEIESLRARAKDAEVAETQLEKEKVLFLRRLAILVPSLAALIYAVAEVVRGFVAHH